MRYTTIVAAAVLALTVAGCAAPGLGGGSYSREQARREQTVRMGYVESVREVNLEGTRSGIGAGTGAVAGASRAARSVTGEVPRWERSQAQWSAASQARPPNRALPPSAASKSRSSSTADKWSRSCRKPTRLSVGRPRAHPVRRRDFTRDAIKSNRSRRFRLWPNRCPLPNRRSPRRARSRATQWLRITRLVLHLLRGLLTEAFLFPLQSPEGRKGAIRHWSARLLRILAVRLHLEGAVEPARPLMFVANHVSWLDIFAVDAVAPARFVAKAEIRGGRCSAGSALRRARFSSTARAAAHCTPQRRSARGVDRGRYLRRLSRRNDDGRIVRAQVPQLAARARACCECGDSTGRNSLRAHRRHRLHGGGV